MALYRISRKIEVIADDIVKEYSKVHNEEINDVIKLAVKYTIDEKEDREKAKNPHDDWISREEKEENG